jgi:hypothetical protein
MWHPHVDDRVRLTQDVPELFLHRGDTGIVRSVWCSPVEAFEVEFQDVAPDSPDSQVRALLSEQFLQVEESEVVML